MSPAYERGPRPGPSVTVFGRLADGATLEKAQTELAIIGARMAAEQRTTHEHLQPRVGPYAKMQMNPNASDQLLMRSFNFIALLLVILLTSTSRSFSSRARRRERVR